MVRVLERIRCGFAEGAIFLSIVGLYHRHKCQSCWRPSLKGGLGRVAGLITKPAINTPTRPTTKR